MKTFLIIMAIALTLVGFAAMAVPVEAQLGFPATLTPFPTFDLVYDSPAQATLARELTNSIWWENAPLVVGTPRPGFVMFIIQMYRWLNDTTNQLIIHSLLLLVVILITLRLAGRVRDWGYKSDSATVTSTDVQLNVQQSDVDRFRGGS